MHSLPEWQVTIKMYKTFCRQRYHFQNYTISPLTVVIQGELCLTRQQLGFNINFHQ